MEEYDELESIHRLLDNWEPIESKETECGLLIIFYGGSILVHAHQRLVIVRGDNWETRIPFDDFDERMAYNIMDRFNKE